MKQMQSNFVLSLKEKLLRLKKIVQIHKSLGTQNMYVAKMYATFGFSI